MYRRNGILLLFLIGIVLGIQLTSVYAADTDKPTSTSPAQDDNSYLENALVFEHKTDLGDVKPSITLPSVGEVVFKMFLFLAIVLVMIYGFSFLLRRTLKDKVTDTTVNTEAIRLLAVKRLDPRKQIYLIDILGKVLVVGADSDHLTVLTEITDPAKVEEAHRLTAIKQDMFTFNPFQNMLDSFAGQYKAGGKGSRHKEKPGQKGLRQQINQLRNTVGS